MKRLKMLLWVLDAGKDRIEKAENRIESLERLTREQNELILGLASELNDLRGKLPAYLMAQPVPRQIRKVSWREFRAAAANATRHPENPSPIPIERNS